MRETTHLLQGNLKTNVVESIGSVPAGTIVTIRTIDPRPPNWTLIEFGGRTGWVAQSAIGGLAGQPDKPATAAPSKPAGPAQPAQQNATPVLISPFSPGAFELQQADAHRRANYPEAEWPYHYYATVSQITPDLRTSLAGVFRYWVAATTLQPLLEVAIPQQVFAAGPDGKLFATELLHIDLKSLGWKLEDWNIIFRQYPGWRGNTAPLVFDALWFIIMLADGTREQIDPRTREPVTKVVAGDDVPVLLGAYNRLLIGKAEPVADDFIQLFKVNFDALVTYGLIEGASDVSVNKRRLIRFLATSYRTIFTVTNDYLRLDKRTDPVLHPFDYKHPKNFDASEWIAALPKRSVTKPDFFGTLPAYFLSNGKNKFIAVASGQIVKGRDFLGSNDIINPGMCPVCHNAGLIPPKRNEWRALIDSGAQIATFDKQGQIDLDLFHYSPVDRDVKEANALHEAGVKAVTGWTCAEFGRNYSALTNYYIGDVTLMDAAWWLYSTPRELRLAIGWSNSSGLPRPLDQRLAGIGSRKSLSMPRLVAEDLVGDLYDILLEWRKLQPAVK